MGQTCTERRNATEYWWENFLECANLDNHDRHGNKALRGILEKKRL
jgi:hypothetical protein